SMCLERDDGVHARMRITTSNARLITRRAHSPTRRALTGEGIHNDVDAEPGIVDSVETLALRMVVPFGAVILAAVEKRDVTVAHHTLKILVHEIVAPAVQLLTRRGRPVGELEEGVVQLVIVGNVDRLGKSNRYLFDRGFVKHAVDIVV